jgi:S1-C subfamily serine protease
MVRFAAAALALVTNLVSLSAFGSDITLLEFSTPTCGYCRQMEPLIHSFEQAGYPIRKVDASVEPQIAQQYNVTRFPTFVMLVDGRETSRTVGAIDSSQLQRLFQQARDVVVAGQLRNAPQAAPPRAPDPVAKRDVLPPPADPRPVPQSSVTNDNSFASLINSSVRLRVDDPQGRSFGTGTIIDARQGEALVITCGHLFRESKGKGPVTVEMFEATAGGVRAAGQVSGWVLNYDLDRDVALVVIRPSGPVTVAPIAPPGTVVERGDRVVSVGCSNGNDPTVAPTRITMLDRYQGPPNIETSGAPVEGRSGGGLFNDKGELIGVCFAADYESNEGLYAALESIHDEVARLNLIPNKGQLAANDSAGPAASLRDEPANLVPVVRGQNDLPSSVPPPSRDPLSPGTRTIGPTSLPTDKPDGLNQAEQAALEEIAKRAAQSEVIVIVRPKEPGAQSEVITLDNVSPEFVRALASRQRDPQAPVTR